MSQITGELSPEAQEALREVLQDSLWFNMEDERIIRRFCEDLAELGFKITLDRIKADDN